MTKCCMCIPGTQLQASGLYSMVLGGVVDHPVSHDCWQSACSCRATQFWLKMKMKTKIKMKMKMKS